MKDLFKNKLFVRMSLSDLISVMGDSLYYIALLTFANGFSNKALAIFIVSLSESLPNLLFFVFGFMADRMNNKIRWIVRIAFIRFLLYVGVCLMVLNGRSLIILVMVTSINLISDCFGKMSESLYTPIFPTIIREDQIEEASGINSAITQTVSAIANLVGATLLIWFSFSELAFINALTFLIVGLIIVSIKTKLKQAETKVIVEKSDFSGFVVEIKESLQLIYKTGLSKAIIDFSLINFLIAPLITLIAIYISKNPAMYSGNYSFEIASITVAISAGMIFGNTIGVKLFAKATFIRLSVFCTVFITLLFCSLFQKMLFITVILTFVVHLIIGTIEPKFSAQVIKYTPRNKLSLISGGINTLLFLSSSISMIVIPFMATLVTVRILVIALVAFSIIVLVLLLSQWLTSKGDYDKK
ncbi:MFS transporter [Pediococcus siamensis]|uniref:MFS transporter n=1 Tax=Pediococcus siamensis TaxID=381829 RepID=UPI0039A150DE